ncbi:MAG: TrkH family potassium uptake protein [Trueperaceae bacterium]
MKSPWNEWNERRSPRRMLAASAGQLGAQPDSVYQLRGRFLTYMLGTALLAMAAAGALFALYAYVLGESVEGFLAVLGVAFPVGVLLRLRGSPNAEPSPREALGSVLLTWLVMPALAGLPYLLAGGFGPIDAFFEAMSGFTTTGATTITDLSSVATSLLMWRALSQWVGGVGIVVMFVAVFPQLAIAGRQLFFAEAPGAYQERLAPRLRSTAALVVGVYASLTLLAAVAFALAGMSPFDAVAHALASLSAGGFSPVPLGMSGYGAAAQWVAVLFMLLAGVSFPLLYRAVSGQPRAILRSTELRAYLLIVLGAGLALALLTRAEYGSGDALRHGLFQAVSVVTTTGFASDDFTHWGQPAQALIVLLLFVGGSAGSASGGVKVARWLIIVKQSVREVRRALHPRAVMPVLVGDRVVPEEVMRSVVAFLTLYLALFVTGTVTLALLGEDLQTAFTAAIACLGNTGVGLGQLGPMGTFESLHPLSRVMLTFLMYAGRLEVVTVFVVFDASFWRRPRRRRVLPARPR